MNGIENTKKEMAILKNGEILYVYLQGNHFQQNNVLTSNNDHVLNKNVVNIYIVYKLDPLASARDKSFTIQNALFGAMQITKNATDNSKNNYKGYGICFDEFNSTSAAVRTGLLWLDSTSTSLHVRFESNSIYHQLQYALGSFGLTTQAQASMYVSNLIQFIISCSTHWAPLARQHKHKPPCTHWAPLLQLMTN